MSSTAERDAKKPKLVGFDNFVRSNPKSDKFQSERFHHVEFYCGDATNVCRRFMFGLGMELISKSDHSTGNHGYASYVLKSNDITFAFTAPYAVTDDVGNMPDANFSQAGAHKFFQDHGLAVKAMGIKVADAAAAYASMVANGMTSVSKPHTTVDEASGESQTIAEVILYGEVSLRVVSGNYSGSFLANYQAPDDLASESEKLCYGLQRLDHAVGNVPDLIQATQYIMKGTGWHEYAEFVAEDVGTVDSGLNSMVLANNNEMVLLPVNEPTHGTRRKSQIQTYLDANMGSGLQHLALKTNDIFQTMRAMRARTFSGGFNFMPRPSDGYYKKLPTRIGVLGEDGCTDGLTRDEFKQVEELGLLVDKDDLGILLQIFTRPLGDRPTLFIEIIQRVGCTRDVSAADAEPVPGVCNPEWEGRVVVKTAEGEKEMSQGAGCGGFGKGNFSELFKSIEDYETSLAINEAK